MCGRFVCLFTHQRTLESFPTLVCCLSRCGERPRASLRLSPCFRFSGRGPRCRTAGPRFLRIPSIVPAAAVPGYVPTMSSSQGAGGFRRPRILPDTGHAASSSQAGNGTSLAAVSVRICLMTRDAGIFPCVYLPFVSILRSSYSTPLPVFLWAVCAFSLLNRRRSLYIPGVASLPVMRFAGTSSRPAGCLFSLSRRRLWCARTHGVFLVRAVTE